MNQNYKYGLFFLGGLAVGALGAMAISRGKLSVKPLATDLISSGIDLRDKALAAVEGVKEDLADVVAEARSSPRKSAKPRKRLKKKPPARSLLKPARP